MKYIVVGIKSAQNGAAASFNLLTRCRVTQDRNTPRMKCSLVLAGIVAVAMAAAAPDGHMESGEAEAEDNDMGKKDLIFLGKNGDWGLFLVLIHFKSITMPIG